MKSATHSAVPTSSKLSLCLVRAIAMNVVTLSPNSLPISGVGALRFGKQNRRCESGISLQLSSELPSRALLKLPLRTSQHDLQKDEKVESSVPNRFKTPSCKPSSGESTSIIENNDVANVHRADFERRRKRRSAS